MRWFKVTIAYDGSAYAGWQVQPNGMTVQQRMEEALAKIVAQPVRITASGRTDAGVHAHGQVVSFHCETSHTCHVLQRALNGNLPHDIAVLNVEEATPGFHAIRDAIQKRYRYLIQDGSVRDVFSRGFVWQLPHPLDVQTMQDAGSRLLGRHDFSSFEATGAERADSIRTILDLTVERQQLELGTRVVIEVEADGFLYNMVRNIVGTLVEIGRGQQTVDWITDVLVAQDRKQAGPTAPARGLYLLHVTYASETTLPPSEL